ncbi:MAG: branched-chain amino acid transaminase [Neisseriaceae bacterium]|nr:MAG: branched-chain amino acid transaminase [Neisseriaceae bacterium]
MSMEDRNGYIWYNGELVEWRSAQTHVLTHSLHYGMGVFEGVRAYQTDKGAAIFRLDDHTNRLFNSAKITRMNIGYSREEINQAHKDVVKANKYSSCYFRPLAFYGASRLGILPDESSVQVIVSAWEWGAYLGDEALENGITAKISSFCRMHVNSMMCKAKATGNYLNSIYAKKEAVREGYDEAILLDPQGYIAEGSGENIFLVSNGKLYTPSLVSALDGITRNTVIRLIQDLGLELIEKDITRDELYLADEIFFTGTAAEITPVSQLDGITVGNGKRGSITQQLQEAFFDVVAGKNEKYQHWLTYVD